MSLNFFSINCNWDSNVHVPLGEKRPYSEFAGVRMRENTDQKNSEYGHFSYSAILGKMTRKMKDRKSGCIANDFESICFARMGYM